MQAKTQLKPKKRMRRVGRIGKKLIEQTHEYLQDIPPPYYCIYCLFIGIEIPILVEEACVNVEHTESKARHPELRFVKGKLAISCPYHNQDKGSMDIDQYLQKLTKQKQEHEGRPGG